MSYVVRLLCIHLIVLQSMLHAVICSL